MRLQPLSFHQYTPALLVILLCYLSFIFPRCQSKYQKGKYAYEYETYDYSHKNNDDVKPVDTRIACYSCSFEQDFDHVQGVVNCNEPFNKLDIPEVMCNGSCSMTHTWHEKPTPDDASSYPGTFTIYRDCLPNCRELVSEMRYRRCCSTKLCNSFTSFSCHSGQNILLFIISALLTLSRILRCFFFF